MALATVLITPSYTLLGQQFRKTPPDIYAGTVAQLAERIASAHFAGEGVLILDPAVAAGLRVTDEWTTVDTPTARVYVGVQSKTWDLYDWGDCDQDTVATFDLFAELVGVAFHRSPGVAGLSLLQALHPKGKTKPIVWETPAPVKAHELAYVPEHWTRYPKDAGMHMHGYDRRRAGLAAMNTVEVARYALRHTRKRAFDATLAGWWQISVPVWNMPELPHPAGYCTEHHHAGPNESCVRWVTTPTVNLLNELADLGLCEGVRFVEDSWTSPKSRLFYRWSQQVEKAWKRAVELTGETEPDPALYGHTEPMPTMRAQNAATVEAAIKEVYRQTAGMFVGARSWVKRPDWYAAVVAMNRCNLWRTAHRVGERTGQWPVQVDGDKLWYRSTLETGAEFAELLSWDEGDRRAGIVLGTNLGQWRNDGYRVVRVRRRPSAVAA